jgi:uncharacterized protein (DUF1015 family)
MQVEPFKAFRFDVGAVGEAGDCVAPPYDVISPDQQEELYRKSPYNLVRIIKGKTNASDDSHDNQYTRAAAFLAGWIDEGVLKQDPAEAIYAYVQDFVLAGARYRRYSFVALGKLEEFGAVVKPHEQLLHKPMIDRLNLKRATSADFGLVFMIYDDPRKVVETIVEEAAGTVPLIDFIDEQEVRHRLFAITAKDDIRQIVDMMSDKSCIIADGHHRYTTGLRYCEENSDPAARYQMMAFANVRQDGLIVLATHRLVCNLDGFDMEQLLFDLEERFEVVEFGFDSTETKTRARQEMLDRMRAEHENDKNAFGIYGSDEAFYVAVLKDARAMDTVVPDKSPAWRALDVSILHKLILEELLGIDEEKQTQGQNLQYIKDTATAIDDSITRIDAGQVQVAFFMNPVKIQQLKTVTDAGERMPQKSTYFYPKVYSGLTINRLEGSQSTIGSEVSSKRDHSEPEIVNRKP